MMNQRIFFPIGQGAFYSEKIGPIRTVYDCGIWYYDRSSKRVEQMVKSAFKDEEIIDLLFVSHFDYDHVSKIPLLLKTFKVKRIVMPLLKKEDKIFLGLLFNLIGAKDRNILSQLVNDPKGFAENRNIDIIAVRPYENANEPGEGQGVEIDNLQGYSEVDSLSEMSFGNAGVAPWVWVPFNYESSKRSPLLFVELSKIPLNPKKLHCASYFEEHRKEIKKAYQSIEGNINENSLFLYSGPSTTPSFSECIPWTSCCNIARHYYPRFRNMRQKAGCIFTGDGDLNKVSIHNVFHKYMTNVGTVQIPHHGSKSSYNQKAFDEGQFFCPISVGVNNNYGHPSVFVLSSLIEADSCPFLVTEKACTHLIFHLDFS